MDNKKDNRFMVKLLPNALKEGFKYGRGNYILFLILSVLTSFVGYFNLRLTEKTANIGYEFLKGEKQDFNQFMKAIMPIVVIVLVLIFIKVLEIIQSRSQTKASKDLSIGFDVGFTKKLSNMTWENYETHGVSMKIEQTKQRGYSSFSSIAIEFISWLISILIYSITYITMIARMSILIAIIFTLISIVYLYIGIYCGKKAYKSYRSNDAIYKKRTYLYRIAQSKEAHQDVIVNRLYHHLVRRWRKMNDLWMDEDIKNTRRAKLYQFIPNLIFAVISFFLLYKVLLEVKAGNQEIGYFSTILLTVISFGYTLMDFSNSMSWYENSFNNYGDYLDLMKSNDELENDGNKLDNKFEIAFNNVTYTYPQSDHKALNNLSINLSSGETIAIVGVNGSGKTTFVNLLMELSKNYSGDIKVNDNIINDTLGILRNSCATIFQDFLSYQFTIKENVILGDLSREIQDEEVIQVLEDVGLYDYVKTLPDGINTVLGQINKGTELSKGQWQRLAVARLLVNKNAKIWILDEPTAYLDPLAEIDMYNFIYRLKKDRTVLFISHRLGFSKNADRIIVFKNGAVIQDGTPKQLMENENSEYKIMYDKQKSWYE